MSVEHAPERAFARTAGRFRLAVLLAAALAVLSSVAAPPVWAGARVEWKKVEVSEDDGGARVAAMLRSYLKSASSKANFGKSGKVVLTARVVDLRWEDRGDVVRLSCTIVGRIENGPSAKSRISFGAAAKDRAVLEKQVLTLVANGLVTRLAEIARNRPPPPKKDG